MARPARANAPSATGRSKARSLAELGRTLERDTAVQGEDVETVSPTSETPDSNRPQSPSPEATRKKPAR